MSEFIDEYQAMRLLASYGIGVPQLRLASDPGAAAAAAQEIGFPVVVKVVSPDVPHKTEAGGVRLNVADAAAARAAAEQVLASVRAKHPEAAVKGFWLPSRSRSNTSCSSASSATRNPAQWWPSDSAASSWRSLRMCPSASCRSSGSTLWR